MSCTRCRQEKSIDRAENAVVEIVSAVDTGKYQSASLLFRFTVVVGYTLAARPARSKFFGAADASAWNLMTVAQANRRFSVRHDRRDIDSSGRVNVPTVY